MDTPLALQVSWTLWAGFFALVAVFLTLDLGVFHRKSHAVSVRESLIWTGIWISIALLFNGFIGWQFGSEAALEFLSGYLLEKSLSVDNIFVILLIFQALAIPSRHQHRILFWGILGAIVFRGIFIGLGAAIVSHFSWVFYIFGLVLLYSGYKMLRHDETEEFNPESNPVIRLLRKLFYVQDDRESGRFFTRHQGIFAITTSFVALITIETADIIFAVDSIPAIFAITTEPFIVFTSNIFAILGLRSLFFAISGISTMFSRLNVGLALVLIFIGAKMLLLHVIHIPTIVSLGVIAVCIGASMVASVMWPDKRDQIPPAV